MQELNQGASRLKAWPVLGITFIQAILFLAHWFIYRTWIAFWFDLGPALTHAVWTALFLLSFTFIFAALLGFRFSSLPVALLYKVAAVWLGLLNFFFLAACLCWLVDAALRMTTLPPHRPLIAAVLYSLAVLTSIYGILNARWVRVRRIPIRLPNLPASWKGRIAVLFSDL